MYSRTGPKKKKKKKKEKSPEQQVLKVTPPWLEMWLTADKEWGVWIHWKFEIMCEEELSHTLELGTLQCVGQTSGQWGMGLEGSRSCISVRINLDWIKSGKSRIIQKERQKELLQSESVITNTLSLFKHLLMEMTHIRWILFHPVSSSHLM